MPEEIKKVCRQGTREKRAGGIFMLRWILKEAGGERFHSFRKICRGKWKRG